jgi:hypothetical protein
MRYGVACPLVQWQPERPRSDEALEFADIFWTGLAPHADVPQDLQGGPQTLQIPLHKPTITAEIGNGELGRTLGKQAFTAQELCVKKD